MCHNISIPTVPAGHDAFWRGILSCLTEGLLEESRVELTAGHRHTLLGVAGSWGEFF